VGEFIVSYREYCCSLYAVTSLGFSFCVFATAALPTEFELCKRVTEKLKGGSL